MPTTPRTQLCETPPRCPIHNIQLVIFRLFDFEKVVATRWYCPECDIEVTR